MLVSWTLVTYAYSVWTWVGGNLIVHTTNKLGSHSSFS